MNVVRALTLKRPWHVAFLLDENPKRVENRPWKPWPNVIGTRIALHAGRGWDPFHSAHIDPADPRCRLEGVFATAVVRGWIHCDQRLLLPLDSDVAYSDTLTSDEARAAAASRWFFGPYGWVLEDVCVLAAPLPCNGALGLWKLPLNIAAQLSEAA